MSNDVDIWNKMRLATRARIGLTRHGHALGTKDILEFQKAQAGARDAVLGVWDHGRTKSALEDSGENTITVFSRVSNRFDHLQRPDLGRKLNETSVAVLNQNECDLAIAVTDGLSAKAIATHFIPFWNVSASKLRELGVKVSPIVLVPYGRVALSDEIGQAMRAQLILMFVGERPGLSSTDSMGIYLTYNPHSGNTDAGRNCISNVRQPDGLDYETAARKLMYLVSESLRRKMSGVELKEDAGTELDGTKTVSLR